MERWLTPICTQIAAAHLRKRSNLRRSAVISVLFGPLSNSNSTEPLSFS